MTTITLVLQNEEGKKSDIVWLIEKKRLLSALKEKTMFTFGPGNPWPVSPTGPGGPAGPISPCRQEDEVTVETTSGYTTLSVCVLNAKIFLTRHFDQCCYLLTFGPDTERPGCPGMPCWPGVPRSPCKMRVGTDLDLMYYQHDFARTWASNIL